MTTVSMLKAAAIAVAAVIAALLVWRFLAVLVYLAFVVAPLAVFIGLVVLALVWRTVRRHPLADVVLGAWLLRHHERRTARRLGRFPPPDARSWRP